MSERSTSELVPLPDISCSWRVHGTGNYDDDCGVGEGCGYNSRDGEGVRGAGLFLFCLFCFLGVVFFFGGEGLWWQYLFFYFFFLLWIFVVDGGGVFGSEP